MRRRRTFVWTLATTQIKNTQTQKKYVRINKLNLGKVREHRRTEYL